MSCPVGCTGSMAATSLETLLNCSSGSPRAEKISLPSSLELLLACPTASRDSSSLSMMTMHLCCCEAFRLLGASSASGCCTSGFTSVLPLRTPVTAAVWHPCMQHLTAVKMQPQARTICVAALWWFVTPGTDRFLAQLANHMAHSMTWRRESTDLLNRIVDRVVCTCAVISLPANDIWKNC